VVLDTLEWGSAIKKTPVVVGNCTGFAVNRVFFPYTQARTTPSLLPTKCPFLLPL
jgi:enoyl-CoA hydratase/3-hydroxyacyl-CoA dehydrogenase